MSEHFANWDEETLDLVVDQVTTGLDEARAGELQRRVAAADLEDFEQAVAALQMGCLGRPEAPPPSLARRLSEDAHRVCDVLTPQPAARPAPSPSSNDAPRGFGLPALIGWAVAAGLLAMLLLRGRETAVTPSTELRGALVASATDLQRIDWSGTDDPLASGVSGDVVWSSDRQEGYMRFRGLESNDPTKNQYQLWIFDQTRADWEAKPVDGGVFDVGPGEEVIVPIRAKLDVREAVLFAITLEVPGGVVVSERERLVLTAAG